ncbi:MAG: hypothetical protein IBJ16_11700 [Chitinophagaceae bacterium]|nr:hypothetical protein [Chitinophagaceae bacterium]
MTDNQFDNFIRAKLHDHSAPVPAGLWDKVNPAKDDDDYKGGFLFPKKYGWGLALLLLIGSTIGYLIFSNTFSSQESTVSSAQTVSSAISATEANHPSLKTSESSQQNFTQNQQGQKNSLTNNNKNDESKSGEVIQTLTLSSSNKTSTEKRSTSSSVNGSSKQEEASFLANEVAVKNTNRKIDPTYIEASPSFIKNNIRQSIPSSNTIAPSISNNQDLSLEQLSLSYPLTFNRKLEEGNIVSLSRLHYSLSGLQREQINSAYAKKFKNIIVCPPSKNGNTDWFVELYAAPEIAFKSIENISATSQYLQRKDSSESMRLGYSAGIRLIKPITDNFLVKAGVQYTQINEKFTYRTENEVRTTTVISVRTIIRGPGDTLRIADTSTVQQTGFKNNTIRNRYRSFDIPVTLGYQFGNDDLQFGVNAGVVFNISSWYQGVILDSSMSAVPISKGNNLI